ncbi:V-type ATP synthase subunit I [Enterococcus sp. DIV0876]|uniref:V-type ATP synthase subunit I n=1 Tax=Enterococcus sp. DIV0876 TaxID=2774633 RepID=UPI003D2F9D73
MAVTKLTKWTLIAPSSEQEALLRGLQAMQMVEVEDVFEQPDNREWVANFFEDAVPLATKSYQETIQRLQAAVLFIRHYGAARKAAKWQRQSMTLSQFEAHFDEAAALAVLAEVEALQKQWTVNQEALEEVERRADWATEWQHLDIPLTTSAPPQSRLFFGSVESPHWEDLAEALRQLGLVHLEVIYADPKKVNFACLFLEQSQSVSALFHRYGVRQEQSEYSLAPAVVLEESKALRERLIQEQQQLVNAIGEYNQQIIFLQQAEELFQTKDARAIVQKRIVQGKQIVVLRGWVAVEEVSVIQQMVREAFNNEVYLSFEGPSAEEVAANKVPTKLKNGSFIQPFEMLTEMYSLPKYDEIDPTPWMAPFYYVFFGMMVADLGYGMLMALVTTIGLHALRLPKGSKRFLTLFQILSVPTMIWGAVYGSFFGATLPFQLLSPSEDFMAIFGLSMVFGGIQLFTGLYLAARENIRKQDILGAVNQGFAWLGLLIGLLVAAAGNWLLHVAALTTMGLILAGFSALLIIIVPILKGPSKVGGLFMGLYDLYGVTSYIGDFVSYSRLMALGISGGSIAAAFNLLVGYLPPAARFSVGIVLLIVLQALNIFLSLLSAYVHAARLQYVEFFGKFFTGGGRAFDTFKPSETYVDFEKENGGNKDD